MARGGGTSDPSGSFYKRLGEELRARGVRLLHGERKPQVVLARGARGGYLKFYTLGPRVSWWGPVPHVCMKLDAACTGRPWMTWALVLHDGSGSGFVVDAAAFRRQSRWWPRLQVGRPDEHYSLKRPDLEQACVDEFGGPKTCADLLVQLLDALPPGPEDVRSDV